MNKTQYSPFHLGDLIRLKLLILGISEPEASIALDMNTLEFSELLNGHYKIDAITALALSKTIGGSAQEWLSHQRYLASPLISAKPYRKELTVEEKPKKHEARNYVLRDDMDDEVSYSGEIGLNEFANPDSPVFAFNALETYAANLRWRVSGMMPQDSNKRLAWLEDRQGKIVAEATVSATTILDNDFQKAIEDEEQAILQGELECNDEEPRSMKP